VSAVPAAAQLVITGCGVVSPAGVGLSALAGALSGSASAQAAPDGDYPPIPIAPVPDLRAADYLGRKGIRALDRTTQLALVACHQALADLAIALTDDDRGRTGVVIGSCTGSISSGSEFSRDTIVQEKPYLVLANQFPSSVMNFCAGQIAIRNGLHGVNATLAYGRVSGLAALRYARNAIVQGHVDRALVGAVEELCPQSAWAWHRSAALVPGTAVGEGAAVFVVETPSGAAAAGRDVLAELLACEIATASTAGLRVALAGCVQRALDRSGITASSVTAVSLSAAGLRGLRAAERDGVRDALGGRPPWSDVGLLGESFSATSTLQIAALLAAPCPERSAGVSLVISVGHEGSVGCLVMRRLPRTAS
jgi:3-oxoacyl-[acyl-carrier-protein] synthase II